jgi:hypothetical protein
MSNINRTVNELSNDYVNQALNANISPAATNVNNAPSLSFKQLANDNYYNLAKALQLGLKFKQQANNNNAENDQDNLSFTGNRKSWISYNLRAINQHGYKAQPQGFRIKNQALLAGHNLIENDNYQLGALAGLAYSYLDWHDDKGNSIIRHNYLGSYLNAQPKPLYNLQASLLYSLDRLYNKKKIDILDKRAYSKYNSHNLGLNLKAGRELAIKSLPNLKSSAFIATGVNYSYNNAYHEYNAPGFEGIYKSSQKMDGHYEAGVKLAADYKFEDNIVSPYLITSLNNMVNIKQARTAMSFDGNNFDSALNPKLNRHNLVKISTGVSSKLADSLSLDLNLLKQHNDHALNLNLKVAL